MVEKRFYFGYKNQNTNISLYKSDLNVQSDSNLNEKDYHSSCYTNSNIRLHKKQN
jgi:hypothetical protein